jgi:sulfide:quinone oxidoreductase
MDIKQISADISVSGQIAVCDLDQLARQGIKSIICNRPDHEVEDEHTTIEIEKHADDLGIELHYLPVDHATISADDVSAFEAAYLSTPKPVHGYCRSGLRAITLWSLMQIKSGVDIDTVIAMAQQAGYDFSNFKEKFSGVLQSFTTSTADANEKHAYELVIVGAGAAGISVASSLLARKDNLRIALIDPATEHYYQPGFTMVGAGVFSLAQTCRTMESVIPQNVSWIKSSVTEFSPDNNYVVLDNGAHVTYDRLVVCPGLKLNWEGIEGLTETLGKNGVTSNYRPDLSEYTWELVQKLGKGKALFTQPPMPIKCAGAPQKVMYLSADHWFHNGRINNIDIEFYNTGGVLFGVDAYVPALQSYIDKYQAKLFFSHKLVKIDGASKTAWFEVSDKDGNVSQIETGFDMIHVCPPQVAPDFIRSSSLVDEAGWVDVDQFTLRHKTYSNIWSLGDVANSPNAKTAAAVRKQVPVVACNIIADIEGKDRNDEFAYDGYGSCPLTVERGKVVLAEFVYGGKLLPTFPAWLVDGTKPSTLAWFLKAWMLPKIYWDGMLKGREWLVKPNTKVTPK